ncbi:small multidrug efflux protein [Agromyces aerolatus]|uniref:small multidrug efflux protein n=1 Tax=Agromyces sp. LY-1074 TaxID=3074080 RepID=UPI002857CAD5|nr:MULTISPECIES: small multidrug efflux protein [unclassified Agromyces]MDR5698550.1 small multidrug efflux protein [Agromyces sp. LY-1074]MDR5704844.1 small multidrug efflux protein [Agromyces sp. LY-1358]
MSLIETFQDLVAQVPDLVQPLIIAGAGAIPFIEGEGAVSIGILGGITPVVAAIAAMIGNFACVAVLVLISAGARQAVVTRHHERVQARAMAGGGEGGAAGAGGAGAGGADLSEIPESPRKAKFQRALVKYGVPGVSLLGPLLLPTQFTATMLAAAGVGKARILIWQGVAIFLWTTVFAVLIGGVLYAVR